MSSIMENYKPALFYRQKAYDIEQTFVVVLSNIVSAYIAHKLNPIWGPYEVRYNRELQKVHKTQADIFSLSNDVDSAIAAIDEEIDKYIREINEQKKIEEKLNGYLKGLEEDNPGAAGLRKGMTDTYKIQYASNFFLILGILFGAYILIYIFGKGIMNGETTSLANSIPTVELPSVSTST